MGYFNSNCVLTGLPISEGDPIYVLPVIRREGHRVAQSWLPLGGYFEARYDGYGRAEALKTNAFTDLLEKLSSSAESVHYFLESDYAIALELEEKLEVKNVYAHRDAFDGYLRAFDGVLEAEADGGYSPVEYGDGGRSRFLDDSPVLIEFLQRSDDLLTEGDQLLQIFQNILESYSPLAKANLQLTFEYLTDSWECYENVFKLNHGLYAQGREIAPAGYSFQDSVLRLNRLILDATGEQLKSLEDSQEY